MILLPFTLMSPLAPSLLIAPITRNLEQLVRTASPLLVWMRVREVVSDQSIQ